MKKQKSNMSVVAILIAIVSLFVFNINPAHAGIEIVYFGGAHLPNDSNSVAWYNASVNRMQQIRNQLGENGNPVGTGKELAVVTALDYTKMITTVSESWNGVLAPGTGEHGNRYHVAFGVFANGGSTFVPSSTSLEMQAYVWDTGTLSYEPYGSFTTTTLSVVNQFRQRMAPGIDGINGTADDVVSPTQSGTIASTGFIFGGQGKGFSPFGSGTDTEQDKINNTIAWLGLNKVAIKYTCSVVYSGGTVVKEKWVYGNGPFPTPAQMMNPNLLRWTSLGEPVLFQKSPDLESWSSGPSWIWKREGLVTDVTVSDFPANPKMFYRMLAH